ncbi:MAG: hypothetical protein CL623_07390 [Arcobacter sp.]|nr:hypothetical protein [Arcobacter sp.]|tara:strand:- start:560 stop:1807 length:1248 start_codon:yes stop_codon:yes gene_type:complete
MAKIPKSIYEKKMKDGSINIMVRFTHDCVTYPVKNFTKLYGCEKRSDAVDKLIQVKALLTANKDPFSKSLDTFSELYENLLNTKEDEGEWAYYTVKNRRHFFNRYIKNEKRIGRKKVEKITYDDIKYFLNQFNNDSSRNTAIDILRPIFNEAYEKDIIHKNFMTFKAFKKKRYATKAEIKTRAEDKQADIIKSLYESIKYYDKELARPRNVESHKAYLYMVVMTAHRYGEILQLRKEHCNLEKMKIKAPKEITKTEAYEYPLPREVFDYVKNHEGGLLFESPSGGSADRVFKRLVNLAEVKLVENHQISSHDCRRMLMSVMVEELGIDSTIADYCLEHKQNDIKAHYLQLEYETKEKSFNKYWDFLRGDIKEEVTVNIDNNTQDNTFEKLEKLVDMFEKGYLSKEQFEMEKNRLY